MTPARAAGEQRHERVVEVATDETNACLACGLIGLAFPQVLFFGYSTLNAILAVGDAESLEVVAFSS